MESTMMKASDFVKKLKARRDMLQAQHKKDLERFRKDLATWKLDLLSWVKKNSAHSITNITVADVKANTDKWHKVTFDTHKFFYGAPKAPAYPSDKTLRKIQAALRQIAITGQKTVKVGHHEIVEYFGESDADEG